MCSSDLYTSASAHYLARISFFPPRARRKTHNSIKPGSFLVTFHASVSLSGNALGIPNHWAAYCLNPMAIAMGSEGRQIALSLEWSTGRTFKHSVLAPAALEDLEARLTSKQLTRQQTLAFVFWLGARDGPCGCPGRAGGADLRWGCHGRSRRRWQAWEQERWTCGMRWC